MKLTGIYPVPSFGAVNIYGLANGPARTIWFSEFSGDAVGKMTTAGVATAYSTGSGSQPLGIALAPSRKRLWTGGYGGTMIAVASSGALTPYPIAGSHIGDILVGPDKNVWFTDYGNNKIGRISRTGVATEFALPAGASPDGMTVGPDKNFWILDGGNHKILKANTSGVVLATYGKGIPANEFFSGIVAAPDGNMYVTLTADNFSVSDKVARLTVAGKFKEIGTLPPDADPNRMAVGSDKNVYFAIGHLQAVGKITLATGKVSFRYFPFTGDVGTNSIVSGPDGRLYLGGAYIIYAISY